MDCNVVDVLETLYFVILSSVVVIHVKFHNNDFLLFIPKYCIHWMLKISWWHNRSTFWFCFLKTVVLILLHKSIADSTWGRFFRNAELERMVDQDLSQLYPEDGSYFQTPTCQAMLRRILLLWCLHHPDYGYCQGKLTYLCFFAYALLKQDHKVEG